MSRALDASVSTELDRRFAAFRDRHHVPGVTYGVVIDGRLAHASSVGVRAVGNESARPSEATRSRICSMTKSFVAAAVLRLRDERRLALDDAVDHHVPELGSLTPPTSDSPAVTIRDLLTMASGLPTDDPWADRHMHRDRAWVDGLFHGGVTFSRPPGTDYEYSNLGWVMLGRVVSNVSGVRAQRYIDETFLRPLGMASTTWDLPGDVDVMTAYRDEDGLHVAETAPLPDGDFAPMAGLWSTVEDLARWVAFFLDAFPPRNDPDVGPLSRASRREMQQAHRAFRSSLDAATGRLNAGGYGFGLVVTHDLRFGHLVHHAGGLPGFGSYMAWLPDHGVGVVGLANLTYAPVHDVVGDVLEVIEGTGANHPRSVEAQPEVVRTAADLVRLVHGWDDAIAERLFASNVFLDERAERRAAEAQRIRDALGRFTTGTPQANSDTGATVELRGEHAVATLTFWLTPERPPRVQRYAFELSDGGRR